LSKNCAGKSAADSEEGGAALHDQNRRQFDSVRQRPIPINILNSHGLFDEDIAFLHKEQACERLGKMGHLCFSYF